MPMSTILSSSILEERMLEETLNTFSNGGQSEVSVAQGVILIDGWLQSLRGDGGISQVVNRLAALRGQLQELQPDPAQLRETLVELADLSAEAAQAPTAEGTWTGGLYQLSLILRHFSEKF
jgi:hypothetical protein